MTRSLRHPTHSYGSSDRKHALYSSSHYRPPVFLALLDLFTLPQDITYAGADDIDALDPEEAGFQSSFSKLGASEKSVHDPVGDVSDSKVFASKQIASRSAQKPGVVSTVSGSLSCTGNSYSDRSTSPRSSEGRARCGRQLCPIHGHQRR